MNVLARLGQKVAQRISNFPHILVGCGTPRPAAPSSPAAAAAAVERPFVCFGGNTQQREEVPGAGRGYQAVNFCGNETMSILHGDRL